MSNELNATKKIFDSAVLITVTHDLKECKTTEPNLSTCIAMQIFRVYRKNKEKTEYPLIVFKGNSPCFTLINSQRKTNIQMQL